MRVSSRLSLLAASAVGVFSASVPSNIQGAPQNITVQNFNTTIATNFMDMLKGKLSCSACKLLVGAVDFGSSFSSWTQKGTLELVVGICILAGEPRDECEGVVNELGPSLTFLLPKISIFGGVTDASWICASLIASCPFPDPTNAIPTISAPDTPRAAPPTTFDPEVKPLYVLHISDMHVDTKYAVGSNADCDYYMCCRTATNVSTKGNFRAASTWGDYNCDVPPKLIDHLLANIEATTGIHPDFTIFTGDLSPHDIWSSTPADTNAATDAGFSLLSQHLQNPVFAAIGNHEASPVNQMPEVPKWPWDATWSAPVQAKPLYQFLSGQYSKWLNTTTAKEFVSQEGAYAVSYGNLRIISINTIMCYVDNFYTLRDFKTHDKGHQLAWMYTQLTAAEAAGNYVWIISHMAPGDTACGHNWSRHYNMLIERFQNTITGQYFGHTHRDEISMFYPNGGNTGDAIGVGIIAPSITPYTNLNPGYRIMAIDPVTFQMIDSKTYIADLTKAAEWDASNSSPEWFLEYSARDSYVSWPSNEFLTPAYWNAIVNQMASNDTIWNTYLNYRSKSQPADAKSCVDDPDCRANLICDIKSGNAKNNCNRPSLFKRSDDDEHVRSFKRDESVPHYKRELCSNHNHDKYA